MQADLCMVCGCAAALMLQAAGELQERLSADRGHLPQGLIACTFHTICVRLLR
jgi:hypothetical protein